MKEKKGRAKLPVADNLERCIEAIQSVPMVHPSAIISINDAHHLESLMWLD